MSKVTKRSRNKASNRVRVRVFIPCSKQLSIQLPNWIIRVLSHPLTCNFPPRVIILWCGNSKMLIFSRKNLLTVSPF